MSRLSTLVNRITDFNRGRDPERLPLKYEAMQEDAFAFFRGTCHLYCEDWPATSRLNNTPVVWVCGDLHVENFGAYKGDNRLVYFDIADFDESALAPCAWDLARLATSALLAAKVHGVKRKDALSFCHIFLDAYAAALRDGKARWIERSTAEGRIGSLLQALQGRKRGSFVSERTELRGRKLGLRIDHDHTLAAGQRDRKRVKRFLRAFADQQPDPGFFRVLDVARRIAGTGSLGLERFSILVEGRGGPGGHFILDLKLAPCSALRGHLKQRQPRWRTEAERVVAVARRMQAISPALLHAVTMDSRPYVLRELMPSQDKLDLAKWRGGSRAFDVLARDLGYVVAWSEIRSGGRDSSATIDELIDFARRPRWREWIVDYAEHYRDIAWDDWKTFRQAYLDHSVPIR